MKRQFVKFLQRLAAITLGSVLVWSSAVHAADNTGTGDVADDPAALVDSNTFQLFSTGATLTLVKTAFLTNDGTQLTSGATVPQGTLVDFMIYVNNESTVAISDVTIQDQLDALFVYQTGTIRLDNSVGNCAATACTAAEEAAIYAAASAAAAGTDVVDAPEPVSFDGTDTVDVGDGNVANGPVNAAASSVLAVVFTVQVQ